MCIRDSASPSQSKAADPSGTVLNCVKEAAKEKGFSIALDIVGAVPVFGNAPATAGRLLRAAYSVNHAITKPAVGALLGTYGMYGGVSAGPNDPTDSFVGVASAGTG